MAPRKRLSGIALILSQSFPCHRLCVLLYAHGVHSTNMPPKSKTTGSYLSTTLTLRHTDFIPDRRYAFTGKLCCTLIAFNTIFYIVFVFLLVFTCVPRHKVRDPTVKGHCLDWQIVLVAGNMVTFVSEVIIWVIPQRITWCLQLKRSKKWGLSALFTIGVFTIICSAVRIYFQARLIKDSRDSTCLGSKICFWGTLKVTAGFLIEWLPSIPALYNSIKKHTWTE